MFNKLISLDPRLSMIAELIGTCECCADIGCDHGRLGAFLLQNGQCSRICLTDISEPSLAKARRLIALLGLDGRTDFLVGNGASILTHRVDAAVIAGMGGETIAEIVENANGRLDGAKLILEPNVAAAQLRQRLNAAGWMIENEVLVRDGRRIYPILVAVQGSQQLTDVEQTVGPVLLKTRPALLNDYAAFRIRVLKKALLGAEKGSDTAMIGAIRSELSTWEGIFE